VQVWAWAAAVGAFGPGPFVDVSATVDSTWELLSYRWAHLWAHPGNVWSHHWSCIGWSVGGRVGRNIRGATVVSMAVGSPGTCVGANRDVEVEH
jgi:hypothetical protein